MENKPISEMSKEELQSIGFILHEELMPLNARVQEIIHNLAIIKKALQNLESQKEDAINKTL